MFLWAVALKINQLKKILLNIKISVTNTADISLFLFYRTRLQTSLLLCKNSLMKIITSWMIETGMWSPLCISTHHICVSVNQANIDFLLNTACYSSMVAYWIRCTNLNWLIFWCIKLPVCGLVAKYNRRAYFFNHSWYIKGGFLYLCGQYIIFILRHNNNFCYLLC